MQLVTLAVEKEAQSKGTKANLEQNAILKQNQHVGAIEEIDLTRQRTIDNTRG